MNTLHAASRESLAAVEQTLPLADDLSAVGNELFSVVGLLSREGSLRRAVSDASTDPAGREQLVRGLLGGKLGAATLDVLAAVVKSRWSSPRELVDGVESLARTALLSRAEAQGRLDAVEDELFRLGRIVEGAPELEQVLTDVSGSADGKTALIRKLLGDKVEAITSTLVEQLVSQLRGRTVVGGLEELAEVAAKRRQRSVAHVTTAVALTEQQQNRLSATLERIYSRPIALHIELDPELRGGLVIKIGDEIIDGSAAGRLDALRRELAS
ncbi:F0F1 ATP synthase subunit delta [Pseudonocardiaceae bacterium YIM PH 21723]|nr:F0F1 ATP synthase subunit delta [Pseudonocardiaceae bacterium YIM PH 21723]